MSLLDYQEKFSALNVYSTRSPHKVAMLLAVMDLIEDGTLTENRIEYSDALRKTFAERFRELDSGTGHGRPFFPFFHLRGDGFWHHRIKFGRYESYRALDSARSRGDIDRHIAYAYLDDELFELLSYGVVRELLAKVLHGNLPDARQPPPPVDGWNWIDCEHCVQAYFEDLSAELRGETDDRTRRLAGLAEKLGDQTKDSIVLMYQRISAVLVGLGFTYLPEYAPVYDDQEQIRSAVFAHLAGRPGDLTSVEGIPAVAESARYITDWRQVLDVQPPQRIPAVSPPQRRYLARHTDYSRREAENRTLGEHGEEFVVLFEQERLKSLDREDLAEEVEWSSRERGDGLGYDVRSFLIDDDGTPRDEEHFIEVKTTNRGKYQPFFITDNELDFSHDHEEAYSLYRVYDFRRPMPRLFQLRGQVDDHARLHPVLYRAAFKGATNS